MASLRRKSSEVRYLKYIQKLMTKNSLCRLYGSLWMSIVGIIRIACSKVSANAIQNKVIIDALFEAGV